MDPKRIIVIGGGAAGLMAAGQAARAGARVVLLEKMDYPGRKLGITGKGRCNITNMAPIDAFISCFGSTGNFLRQSLTAFDNSDLIAFFEKLGIALTRERGGRVFPSDGKATRVARALRAWCTAGGAQITCSTAATALQQAEGRITGVRCGRTTFEADAVILATGGASYPATGSAGDGYRLATAIGHAIVPVRPALVPLETKQSGEINAGGLVLRNVGVQLFIGGRKRAREFGELRITAFGLSGPIILKLSGMAVDALQERNEVCIAIDLKPALDEQKLDARLLRDIAKRAGEPLHSLLRGLMPRELVQVCSRQTGIPLTCPGSRISTKARRRLLRWLKDFRHDVTGHRPFSEAIITAGGISTREVDPRTMESKLVQGLHIAGEVLDIQADTGGYNLQAAFSTGFAAGNAAAKKVT